MVVIKLASPTRAVKPNSRNLQSTEDRSQSFPIQMLLLRDLKEPSKVVSCPPANSSLTPFFLEDSATTRQTPPWLLLP